MPLKEKDLRKAIFPGSFDPFTAGHLKTLLG